MSKKEQHVVANTAGGWSVRTSGADRATRAFTKQGDAVKYARNVAKVQGSTLFVHTKDGRIREMDNYKSEKKHGTKGESTKAAYAKR